MNANDQVRLHIPEEVERLLEQRLIPREVAQEAIRRAEIGGEKLVNPGSGRFLASYRPKTVTYWVEYSRIGEGHYQLHSAYYYRMTMKTGGGMSGNAKASGDSGWICYRCQVPLEVQTVRLQYMQCIFPIDLPVCPRCSMVLVAEELATGKMAEAEQVLEDK